MNQHFRVQLPPSSSSHYKFFKMMGGQKAGRPIMNVTANIINITAQKLY